MPVAPVFRITMTTRHKKRFAEMIQRGRTLAPQMRVISVDMLKETEFNFLADGRKERVPNQWKAIADATVQRRKKGRRGSFLILRDSGDLLNSLTPASGTTFATVGTPQEYAPKHQQGGRWGTSKVFEEIIDVPAHTRKMLVRRETAVVGPLKRKPPKAPKIESTSKVAKMQAKAPKRDRGSDIARQAKKLQRGSASPKGGLVEKEVQVRAHRVRQRSRIDARPFILLHQFMKRRYSGSVVVFIDTGIVQLARAT